MVSLGEYMVLICFSMFSGAPNISSLEKGEIPRSTRTLRLRFLGNLKLNLWDCGGTVSACDFLKVPMASIAFFWLWFFLKFHEFPPFLEAKISSWRTISNLSVRTSSSTARQSWMMWVVTPNSTRLSRCEFLLIEATTLMSGVKLMVDVKNHIGGSQLTNSVKTRSHDIPYRPYRPSPLVPKLRPARCWFTSWWRHVTRAWVTKRGRRTLCADFSQTMSWRYHIVGYKYSWILWCSISNYIQL